MNKVAKTIEFLVWSLFITILLGFTLVGVSCFRHGDIGPYPEVDFMWIVPPASMRLGFVPNRSIQK